ncbi:glycosyltransferase family 2 protein [Salegentibacter maritimus]|uniref:glycosyltransferase family 2 protein n=1 Tax=Salegentibacter maritimus TaxID=2794347 RepID=UPI0018E4410C|nr:glycosyltransferase family 2 protein [Salegentibacter maritimus]MBI6116722.1 glycosyltransferase family 2 protein [Salegentibacter maritimus]
MISLTSIVIPNFNRAHLIGETLDSIISQTYQNWECIVVDDGSTDYTDELMEFYCNKDHRIQYHHRPENRPKGANACRNYGFELSKGDFIQWFDSDDLMARDNLLEKINFLLSSPKYDFCISKLIKFEGNFRSKKFVANEAQIRLPNNLYEAYITGRISILNVNPLWRREVFNVNELYDEKILQFQDLELYSRVIYKNNRMGVINKNLVFVRRMNDSISTKDNGFVLNVDSFLKVKKRIMDRTPNNKVIGEYIVRDLLWAMRWYMAKKEYVNAKRCLSLALKYKGFLPANLQQNLLKVAVFFKLFKTIKRGDTRFRKFLKL